MVEIPERHLMLNTAHRIAKMTREEIIEEIEHKQQLLREARRRCRVLERQQIQEGYQVRPQVITELETLTTQIKTHGREVAGLKQQLGLSGNITVISNTLRMTGTKFITLLAMVSLILLICGIF